jgi:hypothetical protein
MWNWNWNWNWSFFFIKSQELANFTSHKSQQVWVLSLYPTSWVPFCLGCHSRLNPSLSNLVLTLLGMVIILNFFCSIIAFIQTLGSREQFIPMLWAELRGLYRLSRCDPWCQSSFVYDWELKPNPHLFIASPTDQSFIFIFIFYLF